MSSSYLLDVLAFVILAAIVVAVSVGVPRWLSRRHRGRGGWAPSDTPAGASQRPLRTGGPTQGLDQRTAHAPDVTTPVAAWRTSPIPTMPSMDSGRQPLDPTQSYSCGFCGDTAVQGQLEWPVGPLGGKQAFEATCPACGRTIAVEVGDGETWVSERLVRVPSQS